MRFPRKNKPSNEAIEKRLDDAFGEVAAESYGTTDFELLRQKVGARKARTTRKDIPLMAAISNTMSGRRRLTIGLASAVVVLLFLTLVPLPYEITVGYNLAFTGLDPSVQLDTDAYLASLEQIGYNNISVNRNQSGDNLTYAISGLQTEQAAENAAAAFTAMTGVEAVPGIHPIKKTVNGSLCAQAYEKLFTVEVNTAGKTQEEIIAEIKSNLAAQGAVNSEVIMTTDEDGNSTFQIEIESNGE